MTRTQRAKDYAVIGERATRLAPEHEVLLTTDAERLRQLAPSYGFGAHRPSVRAARVGQEACGKGNDSLVRSGQPPVLRAEPRECLEVQPGRELIGVEPCSIHP
jgi:hypothetical protein